MVMVEERERLRSSAGICGKQIEVTVRDEGISSYEDIPKAMKPLYDETGMGTYGMGFAFMEAFMDQLQVISKLGEGTTIIMSKEIGKAQAEE